MGAPKSWGPGSLNPLNPLLQLHCIRAVHMGTGAIP